MSRTEKNIRVLSKFVLLTVFGAVLLLLRYVLRTPQPLKCVVSGEEHLYKWTSGHIYYKVAGAIDAPPLILLHSLEIGASSYEWRHVVDELAKHYRVYTLDLLGFGLSDHPKISYSSTTYIELCRDFIRDVIKAPTTILASGLSAHYALAIAAQSPSECSRVILLSPAGARSVSVKAQWLTPALQNSYLGLFYYACLTARPVLRWRIARQQGLRYTQVSSHHVNEVFSVAHQLGAQHATLALLSDELFLDEATLLTNIQNVTQPVFIVHGAQPQHLPEPPQCTTVSCETIGRAHEQQPIATVARILAWAAPAPFVQATPIEPASVTPEQPAELAHPIVEQELPEAYCVKCRQKRAMIDAKKVVTKNGRSALEAVCPHCQTRLFRFIAG